MDIWYRFTGIAMLDRVLYVSLCLFSLSPHVCLYVCMALHEKQLLVQMMLFLVKISRDFHFRVTENPCLLSLF